jgi:translation initiation factor 1
MDLHDQLKNLFPDHVALPEEKIVESEHELYVQSAPMICKFEKRKGKPTTIISGYDGAEEDFKLLAKELKNKLAVGGTFKDGEIIIQGDYRDRIMKLLQEKGFKTKRVGG